MMMLGSECNECCASGSCCALITETRCCWEEEGVPSSTDSYYITDAERVAVEAQCAAVNGVLRLIGQRRKCLTITTGTPNWAVLGTATAEQCAVSQPCSDTCQPAALPDCPVAPSPYDLTSFLSEPMTFEAALAAVNAINADGGQSDEYSCPSPFVVRAYGPVQFGEPCQSNGLGYRYLTQCLDCVGAIQVCDEECNVILNDFFNPVYAAPDAELEPGQQPCDACNPLP